MGLFNFLFGSKEESNIEFIPDHVWMTIEAKFTGLAKKIEEDVSSDCAAILLVAHFPDVLLGLNDLASHLSSKIPVKVALASNLNSNLASSLRLSTLTIIDIYVAERHPLLSKDKSLEEFAELLPCRCRLTRYLSLDDPLLSRFTGETVINILKKTGLADDEVIISNMVTRSIKGSQKVIEKNEIGNPDAQSAAEWMETNCPE